MTSSLAKAAAPAHANVEQVRLVRGLWSTLVVALLFTIISGLSGPLYLILVY